MDAGSLHVGSLLEVYTTMFGWSLYGTFFEVLSISGFLYYPLLMALYKNWKEPIMSQDDKPASIISQRRMTYDVVSILLVFSFAIVPLANLKVENVKHRAACTKLTSGDTVNLDVRGGATGYTFDDNFNDNSIVRIPALWWLVMSVSGGINQAVTSSFRCFDDIKGMDQQLQNLTIKDAALRQEYSRFATECFIPAKGKFIAALRGGELNKYVQDKADNFFGTAAISGIASVTYPWVTGTDPFFIGSRFYLNTPGFYKPSSNVSLTGKGFQARSAVAGWTYNDSRDRQFYNNEAVAAATADGTISDIGVPLCDEWWTGSGVTGGTVSITGSSTVSSASGLQKKLLSSIEANKAEILSWDALTGGNDFEKIKSWFANLRAHTRGTLLNQSGALEDLIIDRYAGTNPPDFTGAKHDFSAVSVGGGFSATDAIVMSKLGKAAAVKAAPVVALGVGAAAIGFANSMKDFYVTMFIVKKGAPMIQATLLMMLYGLMIFYFVISEYNIDSIITMIFLILGVRFFTSLWVFADYIDARLYVSMYPDISHIGSIVNQGVNRYLLDMVFTVLYIAVPALFLFIMTLAGQRVSQLGGGAGDMSKGLGGVRVGNIGK